MSFEDSFIFFLENPVEDFIAEDLRSKILNEIKG